MERSGGPMSGVPDDLWEELEHRWDELEPQAGKAEKEARDSPEAGRSPWAETSTGNAHSLTTTPLSEQFIIEVGSKYEAECIARELEDHGSDVQRRDGRWVVAAALPQLLELPALLAALDKYLRDNAISSVRVVIDDRSYVMEPAPALRLLRPRGDDPLKCP